MKQTVKLKKSINIDGRTVPVGTKLTFSNESANWRGLTISKNLIPKIAMERGAPEGFVHPEHILSETKKRNPKRTIFRPLFDNVLFDYSGGNRNFYWIPEQDVDKLVKQIIKEHDKYKKQLEGDIVDDGNGAMYNRLIKMYGEKDFDKIHEIIKQYSKKFEIDSRWGFARIVTKKDLDGLVAEIDKEVPRKSGSKGNQNNYPLLADIIADAFSGDLDFAEFTEGVRGSTLIEIENSLKKHKKLVSNGIPYPGDDPEYDKVRKADKGLQALQRLFDKWD